MNIILWIKEWLEKRRYDAWLRRTTMVTITCDESIRSDAKALRLVSDLANAVGAEIDQPARVRNATLEKLLRPVAPCELCQEFGEPSPDRECLTCVSVAEKPDFVTCPTCGDELSHVACSLDARGREVTPEWLDSGYCSKLCYEIRKHGIKKCGLCGSTEDEDELFAVDENGGCICAYCGDLNDDLED